MSLILDGTNGVSDIDGSAATPAIRGTDANTGIFFPAADTIAFAEGGAEIARFDSSGNFIVGGTTALNTSAGRGNITINGSSNAILNFGAGGVDQGYIYHDGTNMLIDNSKSGYQRFYNNGSERMRITSDGDVTIGNTSSSSYRFNVAGGASTRGLRVRSGGNGGITILDVADTNGNSGMLLQANGDFIIASSYAQKASGTTWANPSDIRLKDNIIDYTKGLTELAQVNVKSWEYNGKAGTTVGTKGLGVIADEIMQVLPETVDTYKAKLDLEDEEDADIKRFDATEITWLLVNAVKELNAKVDAQALEIAELKAKP